jgi:uncharacterized C2H2 Zn-finger protein
MWKVIFLAPYFTFAVSDITTASLVPPIMSENQQCSRFATSCYTQAEVEGYSWDEELVFAARSQGSIYAIPSILCSHKLKAPDEPPITASYVPAVTTLFPNVFCSSDPPVQFVPNIARSPVSEGESEKDKLSSQTATSDSHRCKRCGKVFTRTNDVLRHDQSVHNKVKPFPCRFDSCGRAFARRDSRNVITFQICANQSVEA